MKRYKTRVKDAQKIVDAFNALYVIGSPVNWRSATNSDYKESITRSNAFVQNGQALVFLEKRSGYVSIDKQFLKYPA